MRIPCWCTEFTLNKPYTINNGYAVVEAEGGDIELELAMPVQTVRANNAVHECAGRIAVMRGPVVYCAEDVDNGTEIANLCIDVCGSFETEDSSFGLPVIKTTGYMQESTDCLYARADDSYSAVPVTLIPYYAFANRGETEMNVWLLRK